MARVPTDPEDSGRAPKPRALIVTVYGLYARETGGWMSVAALIQMLARCGVDEPSVRSSIFRLKRRGLLTAAKAGGVAGYALSGTAREILDEGDRRIFRRRRATTGEGWLIVVFSVPESERDKRHQLRSRLSWLGFGTVSAGVWIAPAHLLDETRETLARHRLESYVDLFRSDHAGFAATAERVRTWWDLDRLHELYDAFLTRHAPVLSGYRRRRRIDGARAFADYVTALTDWRRLPYLEPGLPLEVLPPHWIGLRAAEVFFDLRRRLAGPAHDYVESLRAAAVSA
nr:PaaX family transcriptional regulator C-terminal domain-containing protein [Amycolatopsis granulosa]